MIDTVLDFEGYIVKLEERDIRFWLSPPRIISNKSNYMQIFFKVFMPSNVRALAIYQEDFLMKHKVRLSIKKTINYYTSKIRFFAGANMEYANTEYYKKKISKRFGYT